MREQLCTVCGAVGEARKKAPGSLATEVVLWLCFCAPGLIYSVWRATCPLKLCAHCGSQAIIPTDSPVARQRLNTPPAQVGRGYLDGNYLQARPADYKKGIPRFVWLVIVAFIAFLCIVWMAYMGSRMPTTP